MNEANEPNQTGDPAAEYLTDEETEERLDRAPLDDSHVWESKEDEGYVRAFFKQVWNLIVRPTSVFRKIDPTSSMWESVTYGLQVSIVAILLSLVWQYPTTGSLFGEGSQGESGLLVIQVAWVFVPAVMFALVNIFISAGLAHLVLKFTGTVDQPYGTAVKVYSYSQTTAVASVVPVVGRFIGAIWNLVLATRGIKQLYGVSRGRAIGAVLVPVLVGVGLVMTIAVFVALGPQIAAMG